MVSTSILMIFAARTISSMYYQLGPLDPFAFFNVFGMSVQENSAADI